MKGRVYKLEIKNLPHQCSCLNMKIIPSGSRLLNTTSVANKHCESPQLGGFKSVSWFFFLVGLNTTTRLVAFSLIIYQALVYSAGQ